jgi:hypothetical protein
MSLFLFFFQFEREKLSTLEDQNEMFSKLAAKVHTFLNGHGLCSWVTIFPFPCRLIINTISSLLFHIQLLKEYKFLKIEGNYDS